MLDVLHEPQPRTALQQRLAATVVLLQVAYPLMGGTARADLTVATVMVFFGASVAHAAGSRGWLWTAQFIAVTAGIGFAAEAAGVSTSLPFGSYSYGAALGPRLLGVPVVVPLAWSMFAYPALLAGRRLAGGCLGTLAAVVALSSWDLFLDPQMVSAGYWHWATPHPGLNGIPLSNEAGWVLVSLLIMIVLSQLPEPDQADRRDAIPVGLFLWTWASSTLANVVFFDRPGVALAGGLVMGLVAVPLIGSLLTASVPPPRTQRHAGTGD